MYLSTCRALYVPGRGTLNPPGRAWSATSAVASTAEPSSTATKTLATTTAKEGHSTRNSQVETHQALPVD